MRRKDVSSAKTVWLKLRFPTREVFVIPAILRSISLVVVVKPPGMLLELLLLERRSLDKRVDDEEGESVGE